MNKAIDICFITDKSYAKYTSLTLYSIVKNANKNTKINFHIFNTEFPDELKNKLKKISNRNIKIEYIDLSEYKATVGSLMQKTRHITKTSYYKFFIADILKNTDKVLYLDGDIIVNKDLNKLFETDVDDYLLAAVEDVGYNFWSKTNELLKLKFKCINSGVMLINCKKWREENLSEKLILTAKDNDKYGLGQDQPVFNLVCKDKIKFLDFKYNVQDTFMRKGQEIIDRDDYKNAVSKEDFYTIMHWTYVRKPWNDIEVAEADWWWKYYLKSPFSDLKDKLFYYSYKKMGKEFTEKHFKNKQITTKKSVMFEDNNTPSLPLVSVFLPYYNDRRYLKEAIESVLNQTYPNWELILLNHATEDDCREIAHSYKDNRIVHIDMEENLGAGGGILFEKMLLASSGKYIKTFCADDVLLPHCLETLVNYMEHHPEKDFAFGNLEYIDGKGKDLKANFFEKRKRFSINNDELKCIRWFARNISFLPYIGNITKREVLLDIKIDKTMVMMFDMSLWLSLLCKGYKIGYCNEIIGNYRIHEAQESSIANVNRVLRYSWFEHSVFWKIFFTIKDVEFAKRIWGQSLYKHCLKRVEDIPFFIAIETIHKQSPFMYEYLSAELEDPVKREYYKKTFGFGIKELRYLVQNDRHVIPAKTLKEKTERHIYGKCPRDLGYLDMLYLFLRKTINILSFRTLIRKIIHKEYTM